MQAQAEEMQQHGEAMEEMEESGPQVVEVLESHGISAADIKKLKDANMFTVESVSQKCQTQFTVAPSLKRVHMSYSIRQIAVALKLEAVLIRHLAMHLSCPFLPSRRHADRLLDASQLDERQGN
jgi:hypothetical protein